MTAQKRLKASVRARMERTGESYMVARRHILNQLSPDQYILRGGIHPDTSSVASALANRGFTDPTNGRPLSEAMILGVGGGLGAGYILWQFEKHDRTVVTIGFRNNSHYPDRWFRKTFERLGVPVVIHETSGQKRAASHLQEALASGLPAIAFISAADLPYWQLPSEQSGWWGHTIVVYGQKSDRFLVDDRNLKRLSLSGQDLSASRDRIPSYKNRLVVVDPAAVELDNDALLQAVESGLVDQVEHLSSKSDSFSLPAIAKWARMLTDERNPKGWDQVFVDGQGLVEALVSTYEGVTEVGIQGGNLRSLYADFLREASKITGRPLAEAEAAYRKAANAWEEFASVCLGIPIVKEIVELDRHRRKAIRLGDEGWDEAKTAGLRSAQLMKSDAGLGHGERRELFGRMAETLRTVYGNEFDALEALAGAVS
ncbi:MAG TPA: BtrH N-terminal domain-containing protein [Acidimicrobiia bacterium]|nr:BtrH N-terminal domain-containing protein [Acidimicrobiia bacterium]